MAAEAWPKGHHSQWEDVFATARARMDERFDFDLEPEVQTDKDRIKLLPCQYCKRTLVVTTFYVLAWAKCGVCTGVHKGPRENGSVEVVQAGRTPPRLAVDLTKCLINPQFAEAWCPMDAGHEMELKTLHHSVAYGPHEDRVIDGRLTPVQIAPGETVMHQCKDCNAVVTYSTTAVTQFRRINEVLEGKNANVSAIQLGTHDDNLERWTRKEDDFIYPVEKEEEPVS